MGTLSFHLPQQLSEAHRLALERSGLAAGYELSPLPVHRTVSESELSLRKDSSDSSYLMAIWPLEGLGEPLLLSSTLRDCPEQYHIVVELARGRLNHLRRQIAEWESIGFELSPEQKTELKDVTRRFGQFVLDPSDSEQIASSDELLRRTFLLSEAIADNFAGQLIQTRHQEQGRITATLGCRLCRLPPLEEQVHYLKSFNAVRIVPLWSELEANESEFTWEALDALVNWACHSGLAVSVGPIIDLAQGPFPKWVEQWSGDLPSLAAYTCDYLETMIRRYKDRVHCWQVLSGFNHTDSLALTEDDRLRLAARLLDSARQIDPEAEWVLGLAQPWGDYLSSEEFTYSPIVFADTLQRAGFTFSAIDLEVLVGNDRRASMSRDVLEYYRLLDLFNYMGIPLEVTLGDGTQNSAPRVETRAQLALSLPNVRSVFWEAWNKADAIRVPNTEYYPHFDPRWLPEMLNLMGLTATRPLDS